MDKNFQLPDWLSDPEDKDRRDDLTHRKEEEPDKSDLLNNFLNSIVPRKESRPAVNPVSPEIGNINPEEYPAIIAPSWLESKISELAKISSSIEFVDTNPERLRNFNFTGLKVNYPSSLNPAQLFSVITTEKPVLVIAGAGSGKTRVIVYRVSFLIEKGVDPQSILLLTFTRKSAKEMLDRVETLLKNNSASKVAGGTFHAFTSNILRKYANMLNIPVNFTIIDPPDSEDIIDLIRTELKFGGKDKKFPRKGRIHDIISYSRNKRTSVREIIKKQYTGLIDYIDDIELIYSGYNRYKKISKLFDFDDLMDVLCDSLKNNTVFRDKIQDKYQYIMVDEFQDTNSVQNEIVNIIASKHQRLMVVGDDSQSIYAFRGADYENILRFPQTYPNAAVIKIEENYRSNQQILEFTNSIIDNAKLGYKKKLYSKISSNHLPVVQRFYGQEEEAGFIVDRIIELTEEGISLGQIAVLNRADWHNRYIQAELSKRGIPYVVVGGFKFNERMHIKDVVAFLRICYNPSDAVSWHRILKYIGGIGQMTATAVVSDIQRDESFSFEAFRQKKFYSDLIILGNMLSKASMPEYSITEKIEIITEYYAPILKSREEDYLNRMQDIIVLIDLSRKYKNLDRFLSDFALDPPSKRLADQSTPLIDEGEEKGKLTLSTVHSAKGLEWYAVFIPHLLEGLFPSNRATNIEEMEEERRLFYVACSRAKEELYLTFPQNLVSYDAFFYLPSRFLIEVERSKYIIGK